MDSKFPYISVVVVNFNGKDCLKDLLESLTAQFFTDFETIVVDNGSIDGSVDFIKSSYPKVIIIENKINTFTAGNNIGIKKAKGEYVFILNNDTELDPYCLEHLSAATKNSNKTVGMWATKILNFYDRDIFDSTGLIIYSDGLSRGRGRLEKDIGQYQNIEEVCFPSGCAALYSKRILDSVGYFDEDFEFYLEDSDLGFRIRLAGWKCEYVPEAKLYHKYSFSMGKYSPRKVFLIERNRIWLVLKNFPLSMLVLIPYYSIKRFTFQLLAMLTKRGAAARFTQQYSSLLLFLTVIRAWVAALSRLFTILQKRKVIFYNKKISYNEFRQLFNKFAISVKDLSLKE
ncbi:MAG: glycosyltransferase family 2 protein [Patescibacteria group bacterium]